MSTEIKQLRSQVEILERRNATLQDRLPEIIQTTIRSTVSYQCFNIFIKLLYLFDFIGRIRSKIKSAFKAEAFNFHPLISYLWPLWLSIFHGFWTSVSLFQVHQLSLCNATNAQNSGRRKVGKTGSSNNGFSLSK